MTLLPAAYAEQEVRISLLADRAKVTVAGEKLKVIDADLGEQLFRSEQPVSFSVVAVEEEGLDIKLPGGARRVRRLFVEAEGALQVEGGVYFGRMEIGPDADNPARIQVVNRLRLETYLLGIVGNEMSPAWHIEALKAQAVAARTYAMQRRAAMRAANRPWDLASTVISQVYKGAERIGPSVIQAVKETKGEVMSFDHDVVEALFHSTCGGATVPAEKAFGGQRDYLVEVECPWCEDSTRYRWKKDYKLSTVANKLRSAKLVDGRLSDVDRDDVDDPVAVKAGGSTKEVRPRDFRRAMGYGSLYSDRFEAETKGGTVKIEGRGFGHGVGMCQWGARGQAEQGRNYRQILAHYYRGAVVRRLY